jgi:hypothetical protein
VRQRLGFAVAKTARPSIFRLLPAASATFAETKILMALHRDIFWVGRQWAVTGYGLQAVDQKLKGNFDIEAVRLWEDGLLERMRAEPWLNVEDFGKALSVARTRFPVPPRKTPPPEERVLGLIETVMKEDSLNDTSLKDKNVKESPIPAPKPAAQKYDMHVDSWPAKFVPQWRIRIKR